MTTQPIPRTKRRLSEAEIRAWEAFLLAHASVTRSVEREAGGRLGLPLGEHHLLVQLARGPDIGLRPTDLAKVSLLTKSGLTRAIDRLVDAGLVQRNVCPSDGRSYYVALTPKGRRAVVRAAPAHIRSIAAHFAELLTSAERVTLTAVMERMAAASTD